MKALAIAADVLELALPGVGMRFERDGAVVVMDLGRPEVAIAVESMLASPRATRSSRTPGRINRGTIYLAKPVLEVCRHCGRMRRGHIRGAHAPRYAGEGSAQVVDCAGAPCVLGADGYQHREGGE